MFHQFKVDGVHRNYLRFLWWENGDITSEPKEFRMTVHLFGATSSPGCANFGPRKIAEDNENRYGTEVANFIKRDFYVDDGLKSVATVPEAVSLIHNAKDMLAEGGLHKFVSNSKEVLETVAPEDRTPHLKSLDFTEDHLPIERALGTQWCIESDSFQFRITLQDKPFTRRGILSTVSSIFDPFGLTDSFMNVLRCFLARRGPVRQLRLDQGTNLVGAKGELKEALEQMDNDEVRNFLLKKECDWFEFKLNTPTASHAGGVWERMIRTVRNALNGLLEEHGSQLGEES